MTRQIRRIVLTSIFAPLALFAIVAVLLAAEIANLWALAGWVDHADRAIAEANEVDKLVLEQESGLRAFLISRDKVLLEPRERIDPTRALTILRTMVSDNAEQVRRVDGIERAYIEWKTHADAAIATPTLGPTELLTRKAKMDELRSLLSQLLETEEALRVQRSHAADLRLWLTALASAGLLTGLGVALAFVTRRNFRIVTAIYSEALAQVDETLRREKEARVQAEDALAMRDRFLSLASHELKTPLTSAKLQLDLLRRSGGKETDRDRIARASRQLDRLAQLVEDLLDVSRISAGKLALVRAPADLAAIVRAVVERHADEARAAGCTLRVEVEEVGEVVTDGQRFDQVVTNLLTNAIKYGRGGEIDLRLRRDGSCVELTVQDRGIGIAPTDHARIFERFERAAHERAYAGLGLGLWIVKTIVEALGATIDLESEPGSGATFRVRLPDSPSPEEGLAEVSPVPR
ncbi:MAG: sensor histidine kinase [Polyangiales bacterium]